MRLLIIGGTRFLGRALVEVALADNHDLTLFNRGQSNPDLFPRVPTLIGDRDGGLDPLRGRRWDAVIDTCGYLPRMVRASAALLAGAVDHYTFVSSISVYDDPDRLGIDEQSRLATIEDETVEEINGETYGALKVLCEAAVTEEMRGRALHVRAGLIVGPHDPTDRFSYWPDRIARGGEVLAPGDPAEPVQFVDVRDIARWILRATVDRRTGPFNVTGPEKRLTMRRLLESCRRVTGSDARFTWVNDDFLQAHRVTAYTEMPLWVPAAFAGLQMADCRQALAAGLTFRPLGDTIRDTLAWLQTRPDDHQWRAGLAPAREANLLTAWHRNHA